MSDMQYVYVCMNHPKCVTIKGGWRRPAGVLPCALTDCVIITGMRTWPLTAPTVLIPYRNKESRDYVYYCSISNSETMHKGRKEIKKYKTACLLNYLSTFAPFAREIVPLSAVVSCKK